jgi:hypothetical protein
MHFFETMKIFDFFQKYMGKMVGTGAEIFDKLEPEAKFLTSWSRSRSGAGAERSRSGAGAEPERSRTKMDRLRNTGATIEKFYFD